MKATDWRNYVPTIIALSGVVTASLAWINESLYLNYYLGAGVLCLFFAWLVAIFIKREDFIKANKWEDQKKAMMLSAKLVQWLHGLRSKTFLSMVALYKLN